MVSKRQLERKLAGLEEGSTTESKRDRIEMCFDGMYAYEPEPELTDALEERGFVVERDIREYADSVTILLQPTPAAGDVFEQVSWHRDGPTADHNDIRIIWEADRLEQVRADAEHPTVYAEPDVPDETERTVIDEGEGWVAVVPSDRLITNTVERRVNAERHGYAILGSVELPLEDSEDHDLVEVDGDPDTERQPRSSNV